ncbi:hypothetical protein FOZ61_009486 [Perkinsus olseni]|uniref:Mitochondrial outer membrane transport complex Sam37/metaxin N-terminal domain-containing protein n=2 Tax=Perkinsus olseni TaxID=32597 RepID=A0A7J6L0F2_PEROL|nr:hypothetical protein FOZ61_009486 [Perkinsus olseni]
MTSPSSEPLCIHYLRTFDESRREVNIDPRVVLLRVYARVSRLNVVFVGSSQPNPIALAGLVMPGAFLDDMADPVGSEGLLQAMRARFGKMKEDRAYHESPELLDEKENGILESENGMVPITWIKETIEDAIEFCTWVYPSCYKEFTTPTMRRSIPFPVNYIYLRSHRAEIAHKWKQSTNEEGESSANGRRIVMRLESLLKALQSYVEIEFPLFAREDFPSGESCARPPSYFDAVLYAYLRALHNIPEKYLSSWTQSSEESKQDKPNIMLLLRGHKKFLDTFERYLQERDSDELGLSDATFASFTANLRLSGAGSEPASVDRSHAAAQNTAQAEHENAIKEKKPGDVLFVGAALSATVIAIVVSALRGAAPAVQT